MKTINLAGVVSEIILTDLAFKAEVKNRNERSANQPFELLVEGVDYETLRLLKIGGPVKVTVDIEVG